MATATLEVIPSEDGLLVALKDEQWTAYVRGYSEQILRAARGIVDADCPWLPKDLVDFAQDVVAGRPHTINLSEWLSVLPEVETTCQKVIIINKGRVVATDSVERLRHTGSGAFEVQVDTAGAADDTAVESYRYPHKRVQALHRKADPTASRPLPRYPYIS